MLQQEMQIGNSQCDNDLMCAIGACECAACIISMVDEQSGDLMHTVADGLYYSTCACFQTQHKLQMDARDAGAVPTFTTTSFVSMNAPPPQSMMYVSPTAQQPVYVAQQPVYGNNGGPMYGAPPPQQAYPQQVYGQPMAPPGQFRTQPPPPQQPQWGGQQAGYGQQQGKY
jgi:hypothetical protein